MIRIALKEGSRWRRLVSSDAEIWFCGQLYDGLRPLAIQDVAARLSELPADDGGLRNGLRSYDGLFAAVIKRASSTLAIVDHIASYPLLIQRRGEDIVIADRAVQIFPDGRIPPDDIDHDAAFALAMSGYTLGGQTLARSVRWLEAGHFAIAANTEVQVGRHYVYSAWEAQHDHDRNWSSELEKTLRSIFERLIRTLDGRTVLVPLSAGLDSRLIASGLHEFGYTNVKCFAYGQPDNFEARASKEIAQRLGYPWTFIPYTQRNQRAAMGKGPHARYRIESDTLAAVPFEQDFFAVAAIMQSGWAPRDAVLINGQSGDFIAGNHIPPSLAPDVTPGPDLRAVLDAMIGKHYSLWNAAKTPEALHKLHEMLCAELRRMHAPLENINGIGYGLYEALENDNRQSKYVVGGQRVYDHLGLDWRLPLWEKPLVEFFRTLPLERKYQRRLFREVLERMNWGGVWRDIDDCRRITPKWVVPPRLLAKLAAAPFGRAHWHAIERRLFAYWTDVVCNFAHLSYARVVRDPRGFRNAISWMTEAYLERHGLDWRGRPA